MEDGHARGLRKEGDGGEKFSLFQDPYFLFAVHASLCGGPRGVAGAWGGAHQEATGYNAGAARASGQDPRVWGAGGSGLPRARSARPAAGHRDPYPPGGSRRLQTVGMPTEHTKHISFTSEWDSCKTTWRSLRSNYLLGALEISWMMRRARML